MKLNTRSEIIGLVLLFVLTISVNAFGATTKRVIWASNPSGGTIYITTCALASVSSEVTGIKGDVETQINLDLTQMTVNMGKADFTQSGLPRVIRGYDGTYPQYKGAATKDIRMVMVGPLTKTPWFSMKRYANVTTWEQMKGKTILGGVTNMYMKYAEATLKYHNLLGQVKDLRMGIGNDDLKRGLVEGRIDVAFAWTGTLMYEYETAGGYNVIEQPLDEVKAIVKQYDQKGWIPTVVKKGEYGAPQNYQTSALPVLLLAGIHVPSNTVYEILKAILENNEKLAKIHQQAGYYNKEGALVTLGCPIHSGAKRYYQEKGMWTAELEAENRNLLSLYGFKE